MAIKKYTNQVSDNVVVSFHMPANSDHLLGKQNSEY